MNFELNSSNPVVKAIVEGTAPLPAQTAAAKGMLPLPQADLLEALVILTRSEDKELSKNAETTLKSQDAAQLKQVISSSDAAPIVLDYFASKETLSQEVYEAVIANPKTPNESIVKFARQTSNGGLLEVVSFNQQLLINTPDLIEAIISNPHRTVEAERRVSEVKKEFFEKARGAEQIANELRAQGKEASAEFLEQAEFAKNLKETGEDGEMSIEDAILLAEHIEVPDDDLDDSWLSLEYIEEIYEETEEERDAIVKKIVGELKADDEISGKRVSMINRVLRMGMKDRAKLAMKGDREARNILIRDPNRIIAQAVIQNPMITEQEIEKVSIMKTVPEDVLRLVATNRKWARNYLIIHNLAKNPRTPIGNVMSILTRLQLRDLTAINKNRNVPDAVRKQALRLATARTGGRG